MKKNCIIDCHTHVGVSINNYLTMGYPYCQSIEDLVIRMKHLDIDYSIVFPTESSYFPLTPDKEQLNSKAISTFPYEKENLNLFNEIFAIFPEYSEMFIPFAMFDPSRETDKQAAWLEELKEKYSFKGLKTVTSYIKSFVNDFQKDNNPIREFAHKHNLPIIFHSSWSETDPWANVFDVLSIVEKNPELNICLAHSARFTKEALDRAKQLPNCFVDTSAFKIHCDLAVENSQTIPPPDKRFDTDYSSPKTAIKDFAETYPETIIWGSDTPYHYFMQSFEDSNGKIIDTKLKAPYDAEINILRALPSELINKIACKNTKKFLGI